MPTYEYECEKCGEHFELTQSMKEAPLDTCPQCGGRVRRLISGGSGFILKGNRQERASHRADGCSLESAGKTCCGRDERCAKPPCEGL